MADNSVFDPGTGGDTYRSKDRTGVKTEIVALDLNPAGTETLMAGAMPVTDNSGSLTVDNTGTFAVQIAANSSVNMAQVAGTATDTNSGVKSAGTQRVVLATDQPQLTNALKVDGSAVTQPVSGTVSVSGTVTADTELPAAAALGDAAANPTSPAIGAFLSCFNGTTWDRVRGDTTNGLFVNVKAQAALPAGTNTIGKVDQGAAGAAAWKVDGSAVTQPVSGTVTANAGTGPFPVSDNSGSLTVDAPLATPLFATVTPSTTGGWSKATALAQTTTKKAVKASAGTFGGYYAYNPNASVAYIQVFDAASAGVTLGTTAPDMVFGIPATGAANLEITNGVNMGTAITLACTTTATGSTAPATGLDLTVFFK